MLHVGDVAHLTAHFALLSALLYCLLPFWFLCVVHYLHMISINDLRYPKQC